ncbi:MAG TPA: FlgD immunoglobulin-like domain containing protein, partial [Patescibacteria group bacterium]|nr:FlgD immunoglobulin-like domain containing protein [Patescibacteria group bacterium]
GSTIGQGFAPGEQILSYEYNSLLVDIVGNVWAVPGGTEHIVFDGLIDMIWPFPDDEMSVTVSGTQAYDCAPGGTRASMAQMDSTEAPYGDIVALRDVHCFIPTVSALDFDTGDLFHDIAGDPDPMSRTPFDTIYYPVENQEHVLITPENADWMMAEIRGAVTAVEPSAALPPYRVALEQNFPNPFNPVTSISFSISHACHVGLAVYNAAGERIGTLANRRYAAGRHTVMWDGTDGRGNPVASGVYFYRIDAGGMNKTRKMVLLR